MTNTDVVRRYLAAFNRGDLDAFDELIAPDYVNHSPSLPDLLADGDLVAAHLLVHGFGPEPARQMQIERLRDGRIVEHWRVTA